MRSSRAVASFAFLILFGGCARAADLRVLFVGNSITYTNNLPAMTEQVAASLKAKPRLRAGFAGRGGATLRDLWNDGNVRSAIARGKYAYVVLQPQSTEVIRTPDETAAYARLFHEEIRRSGAKTMIFETWAPREFDVPQEKYTREYEAIARDLHAPLAPVGDAWEHLQRNGVALFQDGVHPNPAGTYLAACVFYSVLYAHSPAGAEHKPVDAAVADLIQREAWRVVSGHGF